MEIAFNRLVPVWNIINASEASKSHFQNPFRSNFEISRIEKMIMRQKWKWDILEEFSNSLTYDEKVSIFWLGGKGWAFSADFAPISACGFLLQISQGHTLLVTSFLVDFHARTNINCHWMWIFRQKSGKEKTVLTLRR